MARYFFVFNKDNETPGILEIEPGIHYLAV
jgi:hypothetical protein